MALSLFGLWSSKNLKAVRAPERAIASDCNGLVSAIIAPIVQEERLQRKIAADVQTEKLFKLKNTVWNKVMGPHDFENFKDQEYFRWMEIYKDGNDEFSNVNPVSIEQKMALIEVINKRLMGTKLYTQKSVTEEAQKLNALKLRKLQSHMRNFDLSSKLTRKELNSFAADLMIILKGPPASLLDYFTENKTARMNARLMRMVQEDVLIMGLRGIIDRIPQKNSYSLMERGEYIVTRFFHHKVWKYFTLPYELPWFDKVNIPDELLKKIMLNGLEAHDQELITYLKKQNMIDHYEQFRKAYKPIAFAIGFYVYFDKYYHDEKGATLQEQEQQREKFIESFKLLSEQIMDAADSEEKSDMQLKEEQLKRMIENYRVRYQEGPSPLVIKEMRAKIF